MDLVAFVLLISGYTVSKIINPFLIQHLKENKMVRKNYLGEDVISGMGLAIFASLIVLCPISLIIFAKTPSLTFLFGSTIITLTGFLDDIWGNNRHKGLKGHFKELLKGNLTTGSIKAIIGLITAVLVSREVSSSIFSFVINIGLIALSINSLNLFDLRPGRAIKYFIVSLVFTLGMIGINSHTVWLLALAGILINYVPLDMKGIAMLGDTGSNLLGFILGYYATMIPSSFIKLLFLGFLLAIHWYCEKKSLSQLIADVKFLCYLDLLGRPKI